MYYLGKLSSSKISETIGELYEGYPCDENSYGDFLFIAGFESLSKRLTHIDDLETLQLTILLHAVEHHSLVYKDSHEYIKFLIMLLEET